MDIQPIDANVAARFPQISRRGLEVREARDFPIEMIAEQVEFLGGDSADFAVEDGQLRLTSKGDGPGPDQRAETDQAMGRAVAARASNELGFAAFKRVQDAYRADRAATGVTKLMLQMPDFGLDDGSVIGLEITARDPDLGDAALGGIVLFITGAR